MDAQMCLKKLEYVGVLAFATVDANGAPQVRNISAIHYEPDRMVIRCENRGQSMLNACFGLCSPAV